MFYNPISYQLDIKCQRVLEKHGLEEMQGNTFGFSSWKKLLKPSLQPLYEVQYRVHHLWGSPGGERNGNCEKALDLMIQ